MAMPGLSIVTCCKGRLEHLKRALPTFVEQVDSEVIVVDYDCPDHTTDWVRAHFPAVQVATVSEAPILNISRARNLGAKVARAPWLAFCDADQLLTSSFASDLRAWMAPDTYVRTLRSTPSGPVRRPIPLVCEAARFWAVGGYDDAICGWGFEDTELIERLDRCGMREALGAELMVETLPHGNAVRSTFYKHDIDVSAVINYHYATIKRRYFETRKQWFTDLQRHSTYRSVEQAVLTSLAEPGSEATFEIRIADSDPYWAARLTARAIRDFRKARAEIDARRQRPSNV
jgi:glycosyltransferase involved in cell wall biosynthesis